MIDKKSPLISILLAVYNPNYEWFREQLISLNNQTYNNLELIIYDDCPENPFDEKFINQYINKFKYKIIRGKINRGSNKAFEELTRVGQGKYFAYCDQDDIWHEDKLQILFDTIQKDNSVLSYSEMSVIDENGNHKFNSLLEAKPRLNYIYGENLTTSFFFKNCVSGCCMLIKSDIAKSAIPFSGYIVHDQWLCIVASLYGAISFVDKPLCKYRIHSRNQTGSLKNIYTKEDYYNLRVNTLKERINELNRILINIRKNDLEVSKNYKYINIVDIEVFCSMRMEKNLKGIFQYRYLCKNEAYFEIVIKYMPEIFFKYIVSKLK